MICCHPPIPATELHAVAGKLHASSRIGHKLHDLLLDRGAGLTSIAKLVKLDPSLCSRVITTSNSQAFRRGEPAESIDAALLRLGLGNVSRVLGPAISNEVFSDGIPIYGISYAELNKNLVATAVAIKVFSRTTHDDERVGYTLGLMRSLGRLILNEWAEETPTFLATLPPLQTHDHAQTARWETENFGWTSAQVTSLIFAHWWFAADLCEAVRGHMDSQPEEHLPALLHATCWGVSQIGYGLTCETGAWNLTDSVLEKSELSEAKILATIKTLLPEIEKTIAALGLD